MIFLANRDSLRNKRVHRRIANRFQTDATFDSVQLRVATHREPGPYRVVVETDPRVLLSESKYPTKIVRLEIGFDVEGSATHDFYWFNWVEPERNLLFGWHQDTDHPEHGEVHFQINQPDVEVFRKRAEFLNKHPMAVVESRLAQLPDIVRTVGCKDGPPFDLD
ncbi:hypothetical protein [Natronocalculus amylovorans]|uniref:Uncharacterized protein n=1 Tax=Natronocalculus amylovorans TaxID=2917812 RepID=A0AAE3KCC9_9EURY|nr:hypothetical protein [Natronocalculus amylovorans]MCL9817799.1 hypothetical protein [Natronocalculus amylovorans]